VTESTAGFRCHAGKAPNCGAGWACECDCEIQPVASVWTVVKGVCSNRTRDLLRVGQVQGVSRFLRNPRYASDLRFFRVFCHAVWYDDRTVLQLVEQVADRPADDLGQLAVDPEARRRGIGRGLLDTARRRGTAAGTTRVELDTWAFSDDAVAFFRRCGFKIYNLRPRTDTGAPDTPPPSP
jgi:ribosomal protein S18 acetylase RimI-like enzyme